MDQSSGIGSSWCVLKRHPQWIFMVRRNQWDLVWMKGISMIHWEWGESLKHVLNNIRYNYSHRAALAGCTCEGNFQAVLARSSVSSWVGSALPDPVLHTGQLNRWTLTSPFGRHGHGACAWIADVDNWTSGVRHLLSVCMEQSTGWSAWSRAQSSDFQTSTQDLFV